MNFSFVMATRLIELRSLPPSTADHIGDLENARFPHWKFQNFEISDCTWQTPAPDGGPICGFEILEFPMRESCIFEISNFPQNTESRGYPYLRPHQ